MKYSFFGKIHPERATITVSSITPINIRVPSENIEGQLSIVINSSQIIIIFITDNPIDNIFSLKNAIEDIVRSEIDIVGFIYGRGYDVEITSMVDSNDEWIVFGIEIPALQENIKDREGNIDNIFNIVFNKDGNELRRCLADFREAIRSPKDTGFFCYRGIETLRQYYIRKGAKDEKTSWLLLRTELNIEKSVIDNIKQFADSIRHGGDCSISDKERAVVLKDSWDIAFKFALNIHKKHSLN